MVRLALQLLYRRKYRPPKWNHPLYANDAADKVLIKGLKAGKYPITRTSGYLEKGITLRDGIKIMTIHFSEDDGQGIHKGTRDVALLNFQQFQYSNPNVQIQLMERLTPTPFFTFFMENGEQIIMDTYGKDQFQILKDINKVVGKPRELIALETKAVAVNTANFGEGSQCICKVEGQVPCSDAELCTPGHPKSLKGKERSLNVKKVLYGKE